MKIIVQNPSKKSTVHKRQSFPVDSWWIITGYRFELLMKVPSPWLPSHPAECHVYRCLQRPIKKHKTKQNGNNKLCTREMEWKKERKKERKMRYNQMRRKSERGRRRDRRMTLTTGCWRVLNAALNGYRWPLGGKKATISSKKKKQKKKKKISNEHDWVEKIKTGDTRMWSMMINHRIQWSMESYVNYC